VWAKSKSGWCFPFNMLILRRLQNLEAGLSLDDEHAVEVRFVVKFKNAEEVQVNLNRH
jgi:hypothetical protein